MAKSYNALYRFIDSLNRPLYIGKTSDFRKRLMAHKSTSNWYKEASRVVVFTFDNGYIASALEPLVIADFEPKYNKDLTGGEVHWKEKLEIRRTTTFLFDKYTHEEDTIII